MAEQYWADPLIVMPVDGPAVSGTAEASLLDPAVKKQMPGNYFKRNKKVRVVAHGRVSNIVTTPGTLTFRLKWGSTIVLAATQALVVNTTATTNVSFSLYLDMTCRSDGTAATFMLEGWVASVAFGATTAVGFVLIPLSAPAVGSAVDVTANQFFDLTAQWSLTGNTLQVHQVTVDAPN